MFTRFSSASKDGVSSPPKGNHTQVASEVNYSLTKNITDSRSLTLRLVDQKNIAAAETSLTQIDQASTERWRHSDRRQLWANPWPLSEDTTATRPSKPISPKTHASSYRSKVKVIQENQLTIKEPNNRKQEIRIRMTHNLKSMSRQWVYNRTAVLQSRRSIMSNEPNKYIVVVIVVGEAAGTIRN